MYRQYRHACHRMYYIFYSLYRPSRHEIKQRKSNSLYILFNNHPPPPRHPPTVYVIMPTPNYVQKLKINSLPLTVCTGALLVRKLILVPCLHPVWLSPYFPCQLYISRLECNSPCVDCQKICILKQ